VLKSEFIIIVIVLLSTVAFLSLFLLFLGFALFTVVNRITQEDHTISLLDDILKLHVVLFGYHVQVLLPSHVLTFSRF
jgi:hypothetical protein